MCSILQSVSVSAKWLGRRSGNQKVLALLGHFDFVSLSKKLYLLILHIHVCLSGGLVSSEHTDPPIETLDYLCGNQVLTI